MATYVTSVMGWMTVIDAPNKRSALTQAKQLAPGASLLSSDVDETHIRRATDEDVAWYTSMGGTL